MTRISPYLDGFQVIVREGDIMAQRMHVSWDELKEIVAMATQILADPRDLPWRMSDVKPGVVMCDTGYGVSVMIGEFNFVDVAEQVVAEHNDAVKPKVFGGLRALRSLEFDRPGS